jgi:hypothetical protein
MTITPIRKYSGLVHQKVMLQNLPMPETDHGSGDQRRLFYVCPTAATKDQNFLQKFEIFIPGRNDSKPSIEDLNSIVWFGKNTNQGRFSKWDCILLDISKHGNVRNFSIELNFFIRSSDERFVEGATIEFEIYGLSKITYDPHPMRQSFVLGGGNFKLINGTKSPNWETERFIAVDFGNHETTAAIEILKGSMDVKNSVHYLAQKSQFIVANVSDPDGGEGGDGGFFGLWSSNSHYKPSAIRFGTSKTMNINALSYRTAKRDLASFANAEADLDYTREDLSKPNVKALLKSRFTRFEYPSDINPNDMKWVYTPKRIPAELFLCNFLEKIAGHIAPEEARAGMERVGALTGVALTYPTTYGKKEINQLKKALHRAWMRRLGIEQTAPEEFHDREDFKEVREFVSNFPATIHRPEGQVERFPLLETKRSLSPGLMIDEATAAGYFFIKEGVLEARGGFQSGRDVMRFKYPDGIRILMVDCGAGTTDVSLIQAKLNNQGDNLNSSRETLEIKVLDRSGDRFFCGDFITAKVSQLVKAKVFLFQLFRNNREEDVFDAIDDQRVADSFKEMVDNYRRDKELFSKSLARDFREKFHVFVNAINRLFGSSFEYKSYPRDIPRLDTRRNKSDVDTGIADNNPDRIDNLINIIQIAENIKIKIGEEFSRPGRGKEDLCSQVVYLRDFDLEDAEYPINIHKEEIDALVAPELERIITNINDGFLKYVPDRKDIYPDGEKWRRADCVILSGRASLYPTILEKFRDRMAVLFPDEMVRYLHEMVPGYSNGTDSIEMMKRCVVKGALYALRDVNSQTFPVNISRRLEDVLPFDVWYDTHPVFQSGRNYSELIPHNFKLYAQQESGGRTGTLITLYRTFKGESASAGMGGKSILSIHKFERPISGDISIFWNSQTSRFDVIDINNRSNKPVVEEKDPVGNESPLWDGSI